MRYIKFIPLFFIAAILALASCQSDDIIPDNPNNDGGQTNVSIRLSVKSPTVSGMGTRAAVTENGTDGEFMKNWVVLVVQNKQIEQIITSSNFTDERKADSAYVKLNNGSTDFYSFANISLDSLGLSNAKAGDALPDGFDSKALRVEGNQMNVSDFKNGIPMSNKQTVNITSTTNRVDLDVIRMVAKVRVEVTNTDSEPLTVHSFTIRDITRNPGKDTANVSLLPGAISNKDTGKRNTALVPTRDGAIERVTFVDTVPAADRTVPAGETKTYTFYVNESEATNADSSQFLGRHFVLNVRRGVEPNASDTSYVRRGYSSTQDFTFTDWSSMARNEIHELPISISKYGITIDVYPYTAIGVLPQYSYIANLYTIFFGLYGHYDLVPRIINYENGYTYWLENSIGQTEPMLWRRTSRGAAPNNEVHIDSLKLLTDSKQIGIPTGNMTGWGTGLDGNGGTPNYPIVGWNPSAAVPRIECVVGNYTGSAIYTINAGFTDNGTGKKYVLTRPFRIVNTYFDLSNLAKKRR